jgi:hypothetical protein
LHVSQLDQQVRLDPGLIKRDRIASAFSAAISEPSGDFTRLEIALLRPRFPSRRVISPDLKSRFVGRDFRAVR